MGRGETEEDLAEDDWGAGFRLELCCGADGKVGVTGWGWMNGSSSMG